MAGIKVTDLPVLGAAAPDDVMYIVETLTGTSKQINVEDISSYKVYTALLTQIGTGAPTATVLQNTLGGTIVWARGDVGDYTGTLVGAFPANKTFCINGGVSINGGQMYLSRTSNDLINMYSYLINFDDLAFPTSDNVIQGSSIEIRVYP